MDQERNQSVTLNRTVWDLVRIRAAEFAVALFLASILIQIVTLVHEQRRDAVLPTKWFVVNEVYVPDHVIGQNPTVVYDMEILERFRGLKLTEVQRRDIDDLMFTECSGVEVNEYVPGDVIPDRKVSWEWIVGRNCKVGPGSYRLRISYDLHREGWPPKRLVVLSNVFTVREPDGDN